jgi:concentrative nucleoside transporter, CNT family
VSFVVAGPVELELVGKNMCATAILAEATATGDSWSLGLRLMSFVGIWVLLLLTWLMSSDRGRFPWRIVIVGLALQFVLAIIVFSTRSWTMEGAYPDGVLFAAIGFVFENIQAWVRKGTEFLVGLNPNDPAASIEVKLVLLSTFAVGVLSTIVFFSSLMSGLYYLGVIQPIVRGMAWVMQRTLGISGPESLAAAANVFVGQTEAPLVVRPYVPRMTQSELNCLMVGGFATISGGLMAFLVGMGVNPGHLLTASVISAPAAILIAKILQPERPDADLDAELNMVNESEAVNFIDAISSGAADGMKLAINVAAMLLAFLALIAMLNSMIGGLGWIVESALQRMTGEATNLNWSFNGLMGFVFYPIAFIMGIETRDCSAAGQLLGVKMVANEFMAYGTMMEMQKGLSPMSDRTTVIMTYALCGFSNFSSIGIQLGGIGGMAPERRGDLAKLGLRAMLGGAIACCITGCIAGMVL